MSLTCEARRARGCCEPFSGAMEKALAAIAEKENRLAAALRVASVIHLFSTPPQRLESNTPSVMAVYCMVRSVELQAIAMAKIPQESL